jgi:hypothetical protein
MPVTAAYYGARLVRLAVHACRRPGLSRLGDPAPEET